MAVFRVEKTDNYTVMANYHLRDKRLSLRAKGLLSVILSLRDDWEYSVEGLSTLGPDGKDSVRAAIKQLEAAGYITRATAQRDNGRFSGADYIIREMPTDIPEECVSPLAGFPPTVKPPTVKPPTVKPPAENPTQLNTKEVSTIPPIVPQGGRRTKREPKSRPDWMPERFEKFWAAYPIHKSKQSAIRAWDKLKPSNELADQMARALKRQMQSSDWLAGIGVPYPATWVNQQRWEDEETIWPKAEQAAEEDMPVW